jgi:thymidylate kinase
MARPEPFHIRESKPPVIIVSFSGIDGAGKSTQITELERWLHRHGLRTQLLTFWNDVVVLSRYREFMSHKAFKGDRGVGSPEKPLIRRDKNVNSWPVTSLRLCLYFADAVNLCLRVRAAKKGGPDVVIFDRYIYDELANLPLRVPSARWFARLVAKLVPKPDIAYVIDADPVAAHARKPEYPVEFVRRNREAYIALAQLSGTITVIGPGSIEEMKRRIKNEMLQKLAQTESDPESRFSSAAPNPANISPAELIEP